MGFLGGSVVKNLPASSGDLVRSLGEKHLLEKEVATLLQYSCLGNPMDRGASGLQSMKSQRVECDRAHTQLLYDGRKIKYPLLCL